MTTVYRKRWHSETRSSWNSTSLNISPSLTRRHKEWYFQALSERINSDSM